MYINLLYVTEDLDQIRALTLNDSKSNTFFTALKKGKREGGWRGGQERESKRKKHQAIPSKRT